MSMSNFSSAEKRPNTVLSTRPSPTFLSFKNSVTNPFLPSPPAVVFELDRECHPSHKWHSQRQSHQPRPALYTTALCSPTRAALLSFRNHQVAGITHNWAMPFSQHQIHTESLPLAHRTLRCRLPFIVAIPAVAGYICGYLEDRPSKRKRRSVEIGYGRTIVASFGDICL
jgi:hypothetical protein